jgi:hypothetical protein
MLHKALLRAMSSEAAAGASRVRLVLALVVSLLFAGVCQPPHDEYLESVNVSHDVGSSAEPACAVDSRGTVHLVWADDTPGLEQGNPDNEEILYSYKRKDSAWSEPENISNNEWDSHSPSIAVGPDDKVHVAWQDASPDGHWRIFYSWKTQGSGWAVPETISGNYSYVAPKLAVDRAGGVHFVWHYGVSSTGILYAVRSSSGHWSDTMTVLSPLHFVYNTAIVVDSLLDVHAMWNTFSREFYSDKPNGGAWSQALDISNNDSAFGDPWLGVDEQNNVHCVWASEYHPLNTPQVRYRERFADGTWAQAVRPCSLSKVGLHGLATMGPAGEVIIPGGDWDYGVLYVSKDQNQAFGDTVMVGMSKDIKTTEAICCDNTGLVHLFCRNTGVNQPGQFEQDIFTTEFQLRRR